MDQSRSRPVGRAKSCTHCRQAKLACDARKTLTGPCSRCRSRNIACRFDATFKRVFTRRLTEEFSRDLHVLCSDETSCVQPPNVDTTDGGMRGMIPTHIPCQTNMSSSLPWFQASDIQDPQSYSLGTLKLEKNTIVELFQCFEAYYYPHAMFIQPVASIAGLHAKSPLLFWTIVLIASHEHERLAFFYPDLITGIEGVLSPLLIKAIQRLEDIQALLLLCLWPIPQSQYFQNPAWNYVGPASHAAMQLHLHSPPDSGSERNPWPGVALTPEGETDVTERASTWLACFRVGTAVAIMSGLPSPISSQAHTRSIEKAIPTATNLISPSWSVILQILQFMNSALDTLGSIEDHGLHFSLTKMLSEQLNKIKQDNLESWGSELEIEWCNAKLHLLALTFITPSITDPVQNAQICIHRQMILQNAFDIASNLVTQYTTLSQLSVSDLNPGGMLKYMPELYVTPLFNCTAFIFRFMATSVTLTSAKRSQAMSLIIEAHKIFQSYPDRRQFTRAAIHIEAFIDILKQGVPHGMSELVVKNKLGASVMFDAIFHACRQRNLDPRTGEPLNVRD